MKICYNGLNWMQTIDARGGVRGCCMMRDNYLGNLLENSVAEIYAGEKASAIREKLFAGNYDNCIVDNCPYLSNGTLDEHMVEIDEVPQYPSMLLLAHEGVCNYQCTCCSSHDHMEMEKSGNWSHNYDIIEDRLKEVLPYIKTISAHGRGELFACNRILKILSDWKPIAPIDEINVSLETNGSLFDEAHWKQIENLGQYHLNVAITIMSFDEKNYQYLSGTKLPIARLTENLYFVKSLREKGIINELELATVLQEKNFREMPQFADRCINEFKADIVRIRPIRVSQVYDESIEWFTDVRNPYHPYYKEYLDVMQHPIFKNPKVLLWSGEYSSDLGEHPGIQYRKRLQKANQVLRYVDRILQIEDLPERLQRLLKQGNANTLSLYGMGRVGKLIFSSCRDKIAWGELYDGLKNGYCYLDHKVIHPDNSKLMQEDNAILITASQENDCIIKELKEKGFKGAIYSLSDVL